MGDHFKGIVARWRELLGSHDVSHPTQEASAQDTVPGHEIDGMGRPLPPIVVGVDFGTSGTKVAWRDFADRDREPVLLDFGTSRPGYCRFSMPSVVEVQGRQVIVGEEVDGDGRAYRVPKMRLLWGGDDQHSLLRGLDHLPGPEVASALVVAQAIRRAREAIARTVGPGRRLVFNMDIPVSELNDSPDVQARFQTVLDAGIGLSRLLPERPTLEQVREAWHEAQSETQPRGDLIPEAQAVMQGLSRVGRLKKDRLTAALDVGAGTVDMGIFQIVQLTDGDRMPFWAARTHPMGCEDLDRQLMKLLHLEADELSRIRLARIALTAGDTSRAGRYAPIDPALLTRAAEWLVHQYRDPYSCLYGSAYQKQKNTAEWKTLKVAVVGGGALIEGVRSGLYESPRPTVTRRIEPVNFKGGLRCKVAGATKKAPDPSEIPFLLPAVGLAHVTPELAEFVPPDDVNDDPQLTHGATGLYAYDVGET